MTTANPKPVDPFTALGDPHWNAPWRHSQGPGLDRSHPQDRARAAPTAEQLARTAELESLGRLAGGIAHDFNNLLTSILGNTHLALSELPEGAPREAILEVETAARRAKELVAQILAWSGRGRLERVPTDLGVVVTETCQLLSRVIAPAARLTLDIEPNAVVEADPSQLRQVVMNLVTNASDALEGRSGRVEVRVRARAPLAGVPHILLEVEDDGCGLSPEARQRMYEPFFTTKPQGRGLGLAALRGIVDHHEGTIEVRSDTTGTVFRVWFPRSESESLDTPGFAPDRVELPPEGAGTVVVVEDEELVRKVASRMVGRLGYDVLVASNGAEALELLDQAADVVCALVDVQMPGMTGRELLTRLREEYPGLPVVLMTGYAGPGTATDANAPDRWLRKPFSSAELHEALSSTALSRSGPAPSPR